MHTRSRARVSNCVLSEMADSPMADVQPWRGLSRDSCSALCQAGDSNTGKHAHVSSDVDKVQGGKETGGNHEAPAKG